MMFFCQKYELTHFKTYGRNDEKKVLINLQKLSHVAVNVLIRLT